MKKNWKFFLIASLTLGLAPFKDPHIFGKIKWILGGYAFTGENAMKPMDIFDTVLHGSPWILLIVSTVVIIVDKLKKAYV